MPAAPERPASTPRPVGNQKLVRVGDKDILLSRGDRKRVLRKLMSMKLAEGVDAHLGTPAPYANRRSQRP